VPEDVIRRREVGSDDVVEYRDGDRMHAEKCSRHVKLQRYEGPTAEVEGPDMPLRMYAVNRWLPISLWRRRLATYIVGIGEDGGRHPMPPTLSGLSDHGCGCIRVHGLGGLLGHF
jgi:hypothetical protein